MDRANHNRPSVFSTRLDKIPLLEEDIERLLVLAVQFFATMEQRAAIRPGLPCPDPTISYWQDPPSDLANYQSSQKLPSSVDVIIIGSGITGAKVAYDLLVDDPQLSVLMLEARTACSGATGRNGGHTKPASYREFFDDCNSIGEKEAAKIVQLQHKCVKEIHEFARAHSIPCDSWEGNTVNIFYSQNQMSKVKKAVEMMRLYLGNDESVASYKFYDSTETERRFLAQGSVGSVSYAAESLSAYNFVIGFLRLAIQNGLNLQTQTPVTRILRSAEGGQRWFVETSRGTISSTKVVMATNGYTAHLLSEMRGVLVPLRGTITAQRPGQDLPKSGLLNTYSFIGEDGYEYMIPRPQNTDFPGDILIGGGLPKARDGGLYEYGTTNDANVDPDILNYLEENTQSYFGSNWGQDHPEGRVRTAWTGIMGYSADGFPFVGEMPDASGLYITASFQGSGMVLAFLCAHAVALMIRGEDDEKLDSWFPKSFRMRPERMKHTFRGRLHATASMDRDHV